MMLRRLQNAFLVNLDYAAGSALSGVLLAVALIGIFAYARLVATPVAVQAAPRDRLLAGRLAVAVAVTANATSFLLPNSNITSLLLLGRAPLSAPAYLHDTWLAWVLVTAFTLGPLSLWLARAGTGRTGGTATTRDGPSARAALDLIPMFLAASAIRALLAGGLTLHGGLAGQLAAATAAAATVSNLPAAAALHPAGTRGLWAVILAHRHRAPT